VIIFLEFLVFDRIQMIIILSFLGCFLGYPKRS